MRIFAGFELNECINCRYKCAVDSGDALCTNNRTPWQPAVLTTRSAFRQRTAGCYLLQGSLHQRSRSGSVPQQLKTGLLL